MRTILLSLGAMLLASCASMGAGHHQEPDAFVVQASGGA
jgi:hypothetical protein